jgi:protein SCO1/2
MRRPTRGDLVLHFYARRWPDGRHESRLAGRSLVSAPVREVSGEPPSPGDWEGMSPYLQIDLTGYEAFDTPLRLRTLVDEYGDEIRGDLLNAAPRFYPFNSWGTTVRTVQGIYLAAATPGLYGVIRRALARLIASTATALVCVAFAGCGGSHATSGSTGLLARLDVKLPAPAQLRAATPQFALRDSTGRLVRLSHYRGKAVLLTFIYDHCADVCPLIVANLHTALLKLGTAASKVQIIAVSVDPKGDTRATVKAFLAAHEMTGRMEYLIGSFRELAPVWRAYGVQVEASPEKREDAVGHSAFVYGITGSGSALVLHPPTFDPAWIVHDVPLLAAD